MVIEQTEIVAGSDLKSKPMYGHLNMHAGQTILFTSTKGGDDCHKGYSTEYKTYCDHHRFVN